MEEPSKPLTDPKDKEAEGRGTAANYDAAASARSLAAASLRASALRTSVKKRPPKLPNPKDLLNSSVLADYNEARADAIPITRAANHESFMRYFRFGELKTRTLPHPCQEYMNIPH